MSDMFVVCPAGVVTGGPELCHKFVAAVNRITPGRAAVVYFPFSGRHVTPEPYRRYGAPVATVEDFTPTSTVILPEVYADLVGTAPPCRLWFWWMSVDYFVAGATDVAERVETLRRRIDLHIYSSEYARLYLEANELGPAARLFDYVADEFLAAPPTGQRRDVVAFNPRKGLWRTERVLGALTARFGEHDQPKAVALEDMTRDEVIEVLSHAKCYIDFGPHPGKDRLPAEAASLGCCVVTNRRGAAANPVDIAIPTDLKIDDAEEGCEERAADLIHVMLTDYPRQTRRFDGYRAVIAAEPAQFAADVAELLARSAPGAVHEATAGWEQIKGEYVSVAPAEPNRLLVIRPLWHHVDVEWLLMWDAMDKTHVTDVLTVNGACLSMAMQDMVDRALERDDWTHLVIHEHDNVADKDAFDRIARYGDEHHIVGSLYCMHDPPHRAYAYLPDGEGNLRQINARAVQIGLARPALYEVAAVGFGFTTIARWVLEKWPADLKMFVPDSPDVGYSHDLWFCQTARTKLGARVWIDFGLVTGHLTKKAVWPADNQRFLGRDDPELFPDRKPAKK